MPTASGSTGWTIVLAAFDTKNRDELAQMGVNKVHTVANIYDAYVDHRGAVSVPDPDAPPPAPGEKPKMITIKPAIVAVGHFTGPLDPAAKDRLKQIREMEIDHQHPFASAYLAPPDEQPITGATAQYDLRNARALLGKNAKYTLKIGTYVPPPSDPPAKPSDADLAEARKLAEKAVADLRHDGVQAFYFHGPAGSSVTVGVFGDEALGKAEPPTLAQLRQKYPYLLTNGAGVKVGVPGQKEKDMQLQRSILVEIP